MLKPWELSRLKVRYLALIGLVIAIVLFDLSIKALIQQNLNLHQELPLLKGFFNINYVQNMGAAFGLMSSADERFRILFFSVVITAAVLALLGMLRKSIAKSLYESVSLSLILGGALGNAINRLQLGYVVDFLHFHWRDIYHFPSFNLADISICIGVALFIISPLWQAYRKTTKNRWGFVKDYFPP